MTIFKHSRTGRTACAQIPATAGDVSDIPTQYLRQSDLRLPEVSELDTVRHFTVVSQNNFSIDTNPYFLGSCTMKYNTRGAHAAASLPGFLSRHPLTDPSQSQGFLACLHELQTYLTDITGMNAVSLSPMAGAQGEFAGVAMIRAYHESRNDHARTEMLVPDAAHGTNPASAIMCGYQVREIPTLPSGDLDMDALKAALGPQTAGIMLTNPSTLGVFEREIKTIAQWIHEAGGLLYYDGANLNAILGKCRPGDMGFDVMHMNLHKTLATPHGGGGPGSGPVAANARLAPFLPVPRVAVKDQRYFWVDESDYPHTIGRLSAFMGNAGVLLRAYAYLRLLGQEGLVRVAHFATLNANYLMQQLSALGYELAFPERRASHEFIITAKQLKERYQITALDIAKRLLDYGFHAPTIYFPLLVPECLLIEPTETESKETLDAFVTVMQKILEEAKTQAELVRQAPHSQPVRRLDELKAAKEPVLVEA